MDIKNTVFAVDTCEESKEDFFLRTFKGSTIDDGYILSYEGEEYAIYDVEIVGIKIGGGLSFYVLR